MKEQAKIVEAEGPRDELRIEFVPTSTIPARMHAGGFVLIVHGVACAVIWAAVAIQSSAPRHALASLVAIGYATLGTLLIKGNDKYRAWSVRYATAVLCTAFLAGAAGTPSEATALNIIGGVLAVVLLVGRPANLRVGLATVALAACDALLLIGAVKRGAI